MQSRINYRILDPAGNITALVETGVERKDYQAVSGCILKLHPEVEQVGFIVDDENGRRMEMSGLEFCGNASRAFAFNEALREDPPVHELSVNVSGCDHPLHAMISPDMKESEIQMPLPVGVVDVEIDGKGGHIAGKLVVMDGIGHLVIEGAKATEDLFYRIRDWIYSPEAVDVQGRKIKEMPAFGVMFLGDRKGPGEYVMTPVVYVRDVDTVYFEGSCASGSAASAYACAIKNSTDEPVEHYRMIQPGGELEVEVRREGDGITGLKLKGSIARSEILETEIEI